MYESVPLDGAIRQGDIFIGLPKVELSLKAVDVLTESGRIAQQSWTDVANAGVPATASVVVEPVCAIVASQDCDAAREEYINLWQVARLVDVVPEAANTSKNSKKPGKFIALITRSSRINLKFFYLPEAQEYGIADRMAVDFLVSLRLFREDLLEHRHLRICRLADVAYEHFRERCSEFYRRYPYNEWYPMTKTEFGIYKDSQKGADIRPYPGQEAD